MPHNRFYCVEDLQEGREIHLKDKEAHHLFVMRPQVNEIVEVIDGKGALAKARLLLLERHAARLLVESIHREEKRFESVILAQALPRMNHLEWLIEKGTELGADAFWLFPGELSEKTHLSSSQQERLMHLICAACKQCGRLYFPTLAIKPPLEKWIPSSSSLLYGTLEEQTPFLWDLSPAPPTILCIGPEAGFSKEELSCLKERLHGQGVRLSRHTLRTETAAIAGLSLLQINHINSRP